MKLVKVCLIWITAVLPILAGGYGTNTQGTQAMGSLGAFTARAEDGSAVFYNPAGLANLRFSEIAFAVNGTTSRSYYSNNGQNQWSSEIKTDLLPSAFANFKAGRFGFGVGSATTQNYDIEWDDADYPGRFMAQGGAFSVRDFFAGIAFSITDELSIGATYRNAQAEFEHNRVLADQIPNSGGLFYDTLERFDGDGDGDGFIFGLQYYRNRKFSIGVAYHTEVDLDLDGGHLYSQYSAFDDNRAVNAFNQNFQNGNFRTTMTLPSRYQLGFSTRITVRTRLEVDLVRENWSSVQTIDLATQDRSGTATTQTLTRLWDDAYSLRISGDFQQRRALLWRLSLAAEQDVVPDETLDPSFPDYDRFTYGFGVSYIFTNRFIGEAGVAFVLNRDRETQNREFDYTPVGPDYVFANGQRGRFETQQYALSLGVRIRLGKLATE